MNNLLNFLSLVISLLTIKEMLSENDVSYSAESSGSTDTFDETEPMTYL